MLYVQENFKKGIICLTKSSQQPFLFSGIFIFQHQKLDLTPAWQVWIKSSLYHVWNRTLLTVLSRKKNLHILLLSVITHHVLKYLVGILQTLNIPICAKKTGVGLDKQFKTPLKRPELISNPKRKKICINPFAFCT